MNTEEAFNVLSEALKNDDSYAYSWHANIAMACSDAITEALCTRESINDHAIGNEAASRFMKLCFGVETSHKMLLKD